MTETNFAWIEKEREIEQRFQLAKNLAKKAGKILLSHQKQVEIVGEKEGVGNIVTEADVESERKILTEIQTKFPNDSILSEEAGEEKKVSPHLWIIDPLDGTPPYAAGLETFGVSIGFLYNLELVFGVIYLPAKDELFFANKGRGTFVNGKSVHVCSERPLDKSLLAIDYGYTDRRQDFEEIITPLVSHVGYTLTYGSCSYTSCQLARGQIDSYLALRSTLFDLGAAVLIVQEAGGVTTPVDWTKESQLFLASSSDNLRQQLLDLLGKK